MSCPAIDASTLAELLVAEDLSLQLLVAGDLSLHLRIAGALSLQLRIAGDLSLQLQTFGVQLHLLIMAGALFLLRLLDLLFHLVGSSF